MKFCSVSDCGNPASTRGLCKKHYMRFRRHGDPSIKKRPGPRRASATAILLEQFPEQSKRTRARLTRAIQLAGLIRDHFNVEGALDDAVKHATRPNGSLNATLVLAHVEKRMAMLVASRSGFLSDEQFSSFGEKQSFVGKAADEHVSGTANEGL